MNLRTTRGLTWVVLVTLHQSSAFTDSAVAQALGDSAPTSPDDQAPDMEPTDVERASALFDGAFKIDDDNPEASVPSEEAKNRYPGDFGNFLINLSLKADEHIKKGEPLQAAKYYRALATSVPDRAVSFSKLCAAYEAGGQRHEAEQACAAALTREGVTLRDYESYVRLVVAQKEPLTRDQISSVDNLVTHLNEQVPESHALVAELQCQLGLRLKDEARLRECTTTLDRLQPQSEKTIFYSWILAIMQNDRGAATKMVERAKQNNAAPAWIDGLERATAQLRSPTQQFFLDRWQLLLAGAVSLALIAVAVVLFRNRSVFTPGVRKSDA